MSWKELSFVLRGKQRKQVLLALNQPMTATMLSQQLKTHRSTISEILLILEKKKLVLCLDPDQPHTRFYKRTQKGDLIKEEVQKIKS